MYLYNLVQWFDNNYFLFNVNLQNINLLDNDVSYELNIILIYTSTKVLNYTIFSNTKINNSWHHT